MRRYWYKHSLGKSSEKYQEEGKCIKSRRIFSINIGKQNINKTAYGSMTVQMFSVPRFEFEYIQKYNAI